MRILKVLNNSLVLALDDAGREIILMGKGIGYNKSIGYQLDQKDIEKVFVLKDKSISVNIMRLATEIDSRYFELAKAVIDYAIKNYQMKLMEHIYLALTDHLSFAVKRMSEGIVFQNFYTSELKRFNPKEYDIGVYAINLVKKHFGVDLPADEAGNIAFHFINAQQDNPYGSNNREIMETVIRIMDIVKYNLGIKYNEDSIAYARFMTHLRLFVQRLINKDLTQEDNNDLLYEQIISNFNKEYQCAKKIGAYVNEKFGEQLQSQEELYLTIHIHRILEEHKKKP